MANEANMTRRTLVTTIAAAGISSVSFQRTLAAQAAVKETITADDIRNAEWVADITLTDEERSRVAEAMQASLRHRRNLKQAPVTFETLSSLQFDPEAADPDAMTRSLKQPPWLTAAVVPVTPAAGDELSFQTIRQLGHLLRSGRTTSVRLTEHCIQQLEKHDAALKCVVTLTHDLAIQQAHEADEELSRGMDRGPLHGIPWGAKDLIAVPGYATTWGAPQFRDRELPYTATVASKLEEAGAVLVAKLSLGALANGDRWFGGQTRNPWNTNQGSSGSSAGSAAAVAAGLVPFAIGSETLGSIVSPCKRCGVAGLRPTFGRVSRAGCMTLSWTMDKLGPIARTADDCGLVFATIHGSDRRDPSSVQRWFDWPMEADLTGLRVGRVEDTQASAADEKILTVLEASGATIVPVKLPRDLSEWSIATMLDAEAATIFHDMIAAGDTDGLHRWPDIFRRMHYVSAVDYLRASRVRTLLQQRMARLFQRIHLYVGGNGLGITNLTGHPQFVFPTMMSDGKHPQPICSSVTGRLNDEATLLAVAAFVERELDVTSHRPALQPEP